MASSAPAPSSRDHATITITGETYTKHRTHWYTDGNLVILVEKVAFRVFQSFLTRRSPVMESLLVIHQSVEPVGRDIPSRNQETALEGASAIIIHLDDDNAEDVGLLLDVILPQSYGTAPITTKAPWLRLLGLARTAQKYAVSDVLSQVLAVLGKVLPTLEQPHRVRSPVEAAIIINWAWNSNFRHFLPLGFYYLVTGEWPLNTAGSHAMGSLSARDKLRAQQGLARLQARVIRLALSRWENSLIGSSTPKRTCPDRRYTCWMGYGGKLWPSRNNEARWTNLLQHPLEELRMRTDRNRIALHYLCGSCQDEFTSANRRMLGYIVHELENMFTLGDESFPFGVGPEEDYT